MCRCPRNLGERRGFQLMSQQDSSIETQYGWVIIFVSLIINSIGLGAPNILFITLKPIAAELGSDRAMPS